jgi:hypothetical protein
MKSKRYRKITKNRLDECLNLINWKTVSCGCDYYVICNQYGGKTDFVFTSSNHKKPIYDISLDAKFGKGHEYSNGGSCIFTLKHCELYVLYEQGNDKPNCVGISTGKKPNFGAFVQFYNHNKQPLTGSNK